MDNIVRKQAAVESDIPRMKLLYRLLLLLLRVHVQH